MTDRLFSAGRLAAHVGTGIRRTALLLLFSAAVFRGAPAQATSNYEYGADEYVTIVRGMSPDHQYAITAHGGGEMGYDHFHIYLTDAVTGKKIGPLEEIKEILDTGADAFCAKWSKDSQNVTIVWRIDRHEPLKAVSYRIGGGRATATKGPADATNAESQYWADHCGVENVAPSEKVFGTPKKP
jgi:hypothetical protein